MLLLIVCPPFSCVPQVHLYTAGAATCISFVLAGIESTYSTQSFLEWYVLWGAGESRKCVHAPPHTRMFVFLVCRVGDGDAIIAIVAILAVANVVSFQVRADSTLPHSR
jgi:hypothetical protein